MPLLDLPAEIILQITYHLDESPYHDKYTSINSFARANRHLYNIVNSFLYRLDAKEGNAICHAVGNGLIETAQKAHRAGSSAHEGLLYWAVVRDSKSLEFVTLMLDEDTWSERALLGELENASEDGRAEIISRDGVDPSVARFKRNPPLAGAAERGHDAVVDVLLADPRTDPNVLCHFEDRTILEKAAQRGYTNIVRPLLARGASARPNLQMPMHSAVINRDPQMLEIFLNRDDVNPNAIFNGQTPLHRAVDADCEDLVGLLLTDQRVDVDFTGMTNGRTPLLDAVMLNNDKMVKQLLSAGADPNLADRTGLSPAMLIECSNDEARSELLKRHNKDHTVADEREKRRRVMAISD